VVLGGGPFFMSEVTLYTLPAFPGAACYGTMFCLGGQGCESLSSQVVCVQGTCIRGVCGQAETIRCEVLTNESYRGTSLIKEMPTSLGQPYDPRQCPTVGSYGGAALSYERGTPVRLEWGTSPLALALVLESTAQVWTVALYRGTSPIRKRPPP
jgi:hypothetical protein